MGFNHISKEAILWAYDAEGILDPLAKQNLASTQMVELLIDNYNMLCDVLETLTQHVEQCQYCASRNVMDKVTDERCKTLSSVFDERDCDCVPDGT
jgi:hypothetical protein